MTLELDLAAAEWAGRRGRYVALGALLAATASASFLVLAVVNGLEEGIGEEISTLLGGDVRVARGYSGVGDGVVIEDVQDVQAALRFAHPRAEFVPRLETQAIFLQHAGFEGGRGSANASRAAAVLIGIDPAADGRAVDIEPLIVEGRGREAFEREWLGPDGRRLTPILVGRTFLETGNASVMGDEFTWTAVFNLTAGHVENNEIVHTRAVVVGAYETGFGGIDHLVVYAPRGDVARLLGYFPTDPPASVFLVRTKAPEAVVEAARGLGFEAIDAVNFRESYLAPVFWSVRAAAWAIVSLLAAMTAGWMGYTLAHHVEEDRHKIGTLRAVGIPDRVIARTYLLLGGALAAGAALAGIAFGLLLSLVGALAASWTRFIPPAPSAWEAVGLVALSVASGLVTVRWATARAARIPIREALHAP